MNRDHFWLTDDQFSRLAPLLPTDTRGKPRVDDRRVISGIVHVLKSGGRWVDAPDCLRSAEDALQPLRALGREGRLGDIFHALASAGGPPAQVLIDCSAREGASLRSRRQRGEHHQAIGRSRGGRTTKIHALTDGDVPARRLPADRRPGRRLHAPVRCCSSRCAAQHPARRQGLRQQRDPSTRSRARCDANIPPKANRRWKNCFSPHLYRDRNAIERMFCRLKDFRRIATRYDRLATNFLAAVCLAATVSYWL